MPSPRDTSDSAKAPSGPAFSRTQRSELVEPGAPDVVGEVAPTTLTLADFEAIAMDNNPTIAAAAARLQAARATRLQAGLYPNPIIGFHATEVGNLGTAGQQGGFVNQRLITGGKLRLDQAIEEMRVDELHSLFHAQETRVLSDVRVRFYDALVTQQREALTRQMARIGDDLASATTRLVEARQVSENNLLQAEIEAERVHVLHDNAQNEYAESWRRLAAVTGVPTMRIAPLAGDPRADVPDYTWEDCYSMAIGRSAELDAARTREARARLAIARAQKENVPNVDLMVSVRHHNVSRSDVANVQVGVPIPLFDRNQGNISRARAELIAAINEAARIELDLRDRLAVAYRRYSNARQQSDRYTDRILPRARRSLDLVTRGYERGQVDYLTLITAQRTYIQVSLSRLNALRELQEAVALIEGQLLSGSLQTI